LRGILTGEDKWCQLFSEPGNGSDLAGLTTKAVQDGDEWVVNGQKVWNTGAHHAKYGMLLARTDWDVPKHRGITYFALPMERAGRADLIVPQATATGTADDPVIRQEVVEAMTVARVSRWNVERSMIARRQGRPPGPEGSLAKLSGSNIGRASAHVHARMVGAHGMLSGPDSPLDGVIAEIIVSVPAGSIAGGTDEIQHNIIGERVLGLPKEPSVDADIPFREVRTNANRRT